MSFLNPIFLIALISVAVPLLIYLLNLKKPKRVAFSTLSFFSAIQQSSLRKIKLKRRLLLFLRMAAVASLAIALARPQFQGAGQSGSEGATVVGVLIDNSPSMEQVDQNGPWMDQAVKLVAELADAYDENTRFLPEVTNGESLYQPMMSGASLKQAVAQLTPRNAGNDAKNKLLSVLKQLQQAPEPNKRLVILTDGQRSQWKWLQDNSIVASSEAPGSSSASIHDALRSAFGGEPLPALDWIRV
ncbi:MAG: BatA domain-containing protein [Balneolaceae bacterium]